MTKDKIKEVMDACYQAKRIRDMLPALPVDKYVDEYFGNLSEDLGGITDEDADKMIEVVEKFYIVMSNRK